jgi:hypothetical protein
MVSDVDRRWAGGAVREARELLLKMMTLLPRISMKAGTERTKYEKWFGPFQNEEVRYRRVEGHLLEMIAHVQRRGIKLYYRGSGVTKTEIPDDLPGEHRMAQELDKNEWARVQGQDHASREPAYIHIQLGENFFDRARPDSAGGAHQRRFLPASLRRVPVAAAVQRVFESGVEDLLQSARRPNQRSERSGELCDGHFQGDPLPLQFAPGGDRISR